MHKLLQRNNPVMARSLSTAAAHRRLELKQSTVKWGIFSRMEINLDLMPEGRAALACCATDAARQSGSWKTF